LDDGLSSDKLVVGRTFRDPGSDLGARTKTKFVADLLDVILGGAPRNEELLRDFAVREAAGNQARYLALASSKRA
jgi:hypothetical protein